MRQNKSQKNDKQRNTKFSHNDKARNNMVQLRNGNRNSTNLQILNFRYGMPASTRVQFSYEGSSDVNSQWK